MAQALIVAAARCWSSTSCRSGWRRSSCAGLPTWCRRCAAEGIGVLLIEQFTTLALGIAARACVLQRGRTVWAGTLATLREQPEILHGSYLG